MTGSISLNNYDQRMQFHGKAIKMWGDEWPILSHDPTIPSTANEQAWHQYFRDHLGGFPKTYQLYKNGDIRYLNMPEELPENFDPTYKPTR